METIDISHEGLTEPPAVRAAEADHRRCRLGQSRNPAERVLPADTCIVDIATSAHGFGPIWEAVVTDLVVRTRLRRPSHFHQ